MCCASGLKDKFTTIKYRYEDGKIGEVYICEDCSKDYDVEDMKLNE